jgi:heme oxygenase (biliverdin-IX-beta and delta-forming)
MPGHAADSTSPMTKPRSMINLLRAQTSTHHQGLESDLRIQERLSRIETRGPLIAGYMTLHRECEAALRPHLWDMPCLAFSSRFGALRILGKAELPGHGHALADAVFPAVDTKAEALGALYVLEGSTLGGKTILKALRSQGVSTDGLLFLDPYGRAAGALWRSFLGVLERETAHSQPAMNECVSGAIKAFGFAARCLHGEATN